MEYKIDFKQTIEDAFLRYGASTAQDRALPDVRDFLKPGLRQGLYAQYSNKLTYKDKFQKAQKSVAAAMTQSYVHGDAAMYDTFIRAARPWSYRYPLEAVQGNFGNPTSPDSHAHARYVEMKAAEISNILFDGLKKNAIGDEYYSNYDDTEMIPSVFPSIGFWNIVNGCSGIAVALATSVPTFNLKEVNNALITLIRNPNASFDEIYCVPDFPCGGTIINANAVKESLKNGKGESIRLRATLKYIPDQNMIQATELPYSVFTNTVIDQLAELTNNNENYGIDRVVDHTKKEADIRIYLSKGVNPQRMIEKLYKDTSLEYWYSINMILLDQGRFPKIFGWKQACEAYITHIRLCKRREIKFDLDKALARKNIVDGLIKAYSIIDDVVATIRASSNPTEASISLQSKFDFNEEQAKAILAMKLSSLTKLDIVKLNNEREQLIQDIEWYQHLLNDSTALDNELIKILQNVADKFGDARRTKIINLTEKEENVIPQEKDIGVMLFDNNMIRLIEKEDLQGSKRGRKGTNIKPPKNANLLKTLYTTNISTIAIFTNKGRMYTCSLSELDIGNDYSIYELIAPKDDEKVILLIDGTSLNAYNDLITISKQGYIKRSKVSEYNVRSKHGTAAVKLEENDQLVGAYLSASEQDKVFIVTNNGNYNFYPISELNTTGRVSRGVKAIKIQPTEYIQTATIVKENILYKGILTITSTGKGKITPTEDFQITSRQVKGSQVMSLKDEQIALVYAIPDNQERVFISANNKAVLLETTAIPIQNRMTAGVRIIDARNSTTNIEIM